MFWLSRKARTRKILYATSFSCRICSMEMFHVSRMLFDTSGLRCRSNSNSWRILHRLLPLFNLGGNSAIGVSVLCTYAVACDIASRSHSSSASNALASSTSLSLSFLFLTVSSKVVASPAVLRAMLIARYGLTRLPAIRSSRLVHSTVPVRPCGMKSYRLVAFFADRDRRRAPKPAPNSPRLSLLLRTSI